MARLSILALCLLGIGLVAVDAQTSSLRNSSTLPAAPYTLTINPWDNHHRYPPVTVPVGTTISFIWQNDDHGVYLLANDQCPTNFSTNGALGQEELFPVSSKTGGLQNYTTVLNNTGVYYFTCQQGVHCLQGQRLPVEVFNYTQGAPGTVAQYPPSASTTNAPLESHANPNDVYAPSTTTAGK